MGSGTSKDSKQGKTGAQKKGEPTSSTLNKRINLPEEEYEQRTADPRDGWFKDAVAGGSTNQPNWNSTQGIKTSTLYVQNGQSKPKAPETKLSKSSQRHPTRKGALGPVDNSQVVIATNDTLSDPWMNGTIPCSNLPQTVKTHQEHSKLENRLSSSTRKHSPPEDLAKLHSSQRVDQENWENLHSGHENAHSSQKDDQGLSSVAQEPYLVAFANGRTPDSRHSLSFETSDQKPRNLKVNTKADTSLRVTQPFASDLIRHEVPEGTLSAHEPQLKTIANGEERGVKTISGEGVTEGTLEPIQEESDTGQEHSELEEVDRMGTKHDKIRVTSKPVEKKGDEERANEWDMWQVEYNVKKDDRKLNANVDFYKNKICYKPRGKYIEEIHREWKYDHKTLESNHSHIQWLFPIPESSGMNTSAQPLQFHEAQAIKSDKKSMKRVLKSYKMMLDFYGLEMKDAMTGELKRSADWKSRFEHLNQSVHNYRRLSRIIKSLGALGYSKYQEPLVKTLMNECFVEKTLPKMSGAIWNFYIPSVLNEEQKQELYTLYQDVAQVNEDAIDQEASASASKMGFHNESNTPANISVGDPAKSSGLNTETKPTTNVETEQGNKTGESGKAGTKPSEQVGPPKINAPDECKKSKGLDF